MNRLEQVLNDEVNVLLDRLAGSVPGGCLEALVAASPGLRKRLEVVEGELAAARAAILEGYGRWRRSLDDLESLWALAAWKSAAPEAVGEGDRMSHAA
jgi:hypothetical protein